MGNSETNHWTKKLQKGSFSVGDVKIRSQKGNLVG